MKNLLMVILAMLILTTGYSQGSRAITGRVLNANTGKPVYNAEVTIFKTEISTHTNFLGYFELKLDKGVDELIVSGIGYATIKITVPKAAEFDVALNPEKTKLGSVNIYEYLQGSQLASEKKTTSKDSLTHEAVYEGGWDNFYAKLSKLLANDPRFDSSEFRGSLTFGVSGLGQLVEVDYFSSDGNENNEEAVIEAMAKLTDWNPAQNKGVQTEQYFVLSLYFSSITGEIWHIVEEPATPPGGYQKFYQLVGENLRYPAEAREARIQGKVYVQFIVDKDGSLKDIKVVKGIGGGCDEEVVRVLKLSPKWSPPKQRGKPVRQRIILPITFNLGIPLPKGASITQGSDDRAVVSSNFLSSTIRPTIPEYPGGKLELDKFIKKNKREIDKPLPINKFGNAVIVEVMVMSDGSLKNIQISESLGKEFDDEALRVASLMPNNWTPGTEDGKVVDSKAYFPIRFHQVSIVKAESSFKHYEKGIGLFASNNYAKAIKEFSKAIEKNPSEYRFYYSRGVTYLEQYQKKEGCADLELIKSLDETAKELYAKFCVEK